ELACRPNRGAETLDDLSGLVGRIREQRLQASNDDAQTLGVVRRGRRGSRQIREEDERERVRQPPQGRGSDAWTRADLPVALSERPETRQQVTTVDGRNVAG